MGIEIERKFLVVNDSWRAGAKGTRYVQGYLQSGVCTVRVRIEGSVAKLAIKGRAKGIARSEFEYEIPMADARTMLQEMTISSLVRKTRYVVPHAGKKWEIDVFEGDNAGLIVAEIELESEDEIFDLPPWAGDEVTADRRYSNASLAEHPFLQW